MSEVGEKSVEELLAPHLDEAPPWYWYNGNCMTAVKEGDERVQLLKGIEERLYFTLERYRSWLFEELDFEESTLEANYNNPTHEPDDDALADIQKQLEVAQWKAGEYRRISEYIWEKLHSQSLKTLRHW